MVKLPVNDISILTDGAILPSSLWHDYLSRSCAIPDTRTGPERAVKMPEGFKPQEGPRTEADDRPEWNRTQQLLAQAEKHAAGIRKARNRGAR